MEPVKPRISVEYAENVTFVTFTDEKILEETDIKALQVSIMAVIEETEKINLVLNFCNVKFLSSAVLGFLLRVSKKVYEKNGRLVLCNITPKILEIFKITRLTEIFNIQKNTENAAESLANSD